MKLFYKNCIVAVAILFSSALLNAQRSITSFDKDWKFIKEDISQASSPDFNDAAWRLLNVPHDWSVEYPLNRANPSGRGGGYAETGIGWYRKTFMLDAAQSTKKFFIEFDGIMMNSDVWVNGQHLGRRP